MTMNQRMCCWLIHEQIQNPNCKPKIQIANPKYKFQTQNTNCKPKIQIANPELLTLSIVYCIDCLCLGQFELMQYNMQLIEIAHQSFLLFFVFRMNFMKTVLSFDG